MKNSHIVLGLLGLTFGCGARDEVKTPSAASETKTIVAKQRTSDDYFVNSVGMRFKWVTPSEFTMGSPNGKEDPAQGVPQRRVRVKREYYLGVSEVTQSQWVAVMSTRPWEGHGVKDGADLPASFITWAEAVSFCHVLSRKEGDVYRLPTEIEWEYACRAGSNRDYCFGNDATKSEEYAWSKHNAEGHAHAVGMKSPNQWGFHDMHGNVLEWCYDVFRSDKIPAAVDSSKQSRQDIYRVLRGGSWLGSNTECRSAQRFKLALDARRNNVGFRVLRVPPDDLHPVRKPPTGAESIEFLSKVPVNHLTQDDISFHLRSLRTREQKHLHAAVPALIRILKELQSQGYASGKAFRIPGAASHIIWPGLSHFECPEFGASGEVGVGA